MAEGTSREPIDFAPPAVEIEKRADGSYLLFLPAGTWDVSVDAFGYATEVATGVVVVADQTTTRNFALDPLPRFTVTGMVRAAEDGTPIEGASVQALGTPVPPDVTARLCVKPAPIPAASVGSSF